MVVTKYFLVPNTKPRCQSGKERGKRIDLSKTSLPNWNVNWMPNASKAHNKCITGTSHNNVKPKNCAWSFFMLWFHGGSRCASIFTFWLLKRIVKKTLKLVLHELHVQIIHQLNLKVLVISFSFPFFSLSLPISSSLWHFLAFTLLEMRLIVTQIAIGYCFKLKLSIGTQSATEKIFMQANVHVQ